MTNIYNFTSPPEYLCAIWKQKKKNNALFSIRAWARQLGFTNHTIAYEIIQGRRKISSRYIPAIVNNLKLDSNEQTYFEAMINLQKSHNTNERNYHLEKVKKLQQIGLMELVEVDEPSPFEDPLYFLILEHISSKLFEGDAKSIHEKIVLNRSIEQVEQALTHLVDLKLLEKTETGYHTIRDLIASKYNKPKMAAQQYHHNLLLAAGEQLTIQKVAQCEYGSYILNLNKQSLPKAKKLIRNFVKNFIHEVQAAPEEAEETYNIGIQLFALTRQTDQD